MREEREVLSTPWYYALARVIVVSAISLIGLAIVAVQRQRLPRALFILVSLAGSMFGDVFVHLLPGAYAESRASEATALTVLAIIGALITLVASRSTRQFVAVLLPLTAGNSPFTWLARTCCPSSTKSSHPPNRAFSSSLR
jgi:hypothetical protein